MVATGDSVGYIKSENLQTLVRYFTISHGTAKTTGEVPAYAFPSEAAETLCTFPINADIQVVSTVGPWLRVVTDNGAGYVKAMDKRLRITIKERERYLRNNSFLFMVTPALSQPSAPMYQTPDASGKVLRQCFPGEIMGVENAGEDWCMVFLLDGDGEEYGFIRTEHLTLIQEQ